MLQVPGDLPLLQSGDVDALVASHDPAPAVTIAPSRDHRGSNAVLCSPPDVLPLRFGEDSFVPHLARALSLGVQPRIRQCEGFGFDVDTPSDLLALLEPRSRQPGRHTCSYLRDSGLLAGRVAAASPRK